MTFSLKDNSESVAEETSQQRDQLVMRLFNSVAGAFDVFGFYLGLKLGFYQALAEHGRLNVAELAANTNTEPRYVREWLEQQTVTGILVTEDVAGVLYFAIPVGYTEVLTDTKSLNYLLPLVQTLVGAITPLQAVVKAYRQGGGVPYREYGPDFLEGQAGMNKAMFLTLLGTEWLPAISDIDARLKADPPAAIADIGCGAGWSSIGMAQSYPKVRVDGFDLDEASVALAQTNANVLGMSGQVNFAVRDAADPTLAGQYDLVTLFECLHDMAQPVAALRTLRDLLNKTGALIVMDERVGEAFTAQPGQLDWLFYGFSILHCLPVGMADQPSAGTGTVMRQTTLQRYAEAAGFTRLEVLPIENEFYRFYRLYQ